MSRVLLVEDNETTNFISKLALRSAGLEDVDEVLNGMEACSYLEKGCPDIIFLDINMPVMDGWEFLDEKKTKIPCKNVKVAMLTSSLRPSDRKKAENYPCVIAYLEKPLTKEKVEELKQKIAT
ncbi:response regulator [Reichenbachiella sp. MALMAid0571]|uniref:response regulator n=1 Tax=Reichenbachiella sp. MALMAid0571 TaxID=3143939 RepID=UPI0032DF5298